MSIKRLAEGYMIAAAAREEIPTLMAIDLAAGALFDGTGLLPEGEEDEHVPAEIYEAAIKDGHLHTARDRLGVLIGFALTSIRPGRRGDWLYLDQISVDPRHGRKGVGGALLRRVIGEARDRKLKKVSLSTFRDVAWNGPFYRRYGFRELPAKKLEDWMVEIEIAQDARGIDTSLRCFMARRLGVL